MLEPAQAGGFFLDAANEVVEVVTGGWREGVEESYEAVTAEGAKEERVEGRHQLKAPVVPGSSHVTEVLTFLPYVHASVGHGERLDMKRKLLIFTILGVVLVLGVVIANHLPKRYQVHQSLAQATLFWNNQEAFLFLDTITAGRAQNALQREIIRTRYGAVLGLSGMEFGRELKAFHLLASGTLELPEVPKDATALGSWELVEGKLELTTYGNGYKKQSRIRWDGKEFVTVQTDPPDPAKRTTLKPETEDDEEPTSSLVKDQRAAFKAAGWHRKTLTGYEGATGEATLNLDLGDSKFQLTVESTQPRKEPDQEADFLSGGATRLQLSGNSLPAATTLWEQSGWQEVGKAEYDRRVPPNPRQVSLSNKFWLWLAILVALVSWKVWAWIQVIFSFATVKKRVIKNMATTMSFPAASAAQFPRLDIAELERYTREFESMGFTRLIDTSPTSDSPNNPSLFCRLMVHTGHHCYGEISQIFPRGKAPMEMRCAISSHLQNGWSMAFSNRKPLAASSMIRRPKALGISMPDASSAELLQSLLTLRQQVCLDLGVAPLTEDSLESFIAKAQQSIADMRIAVKERNFATALPQYYYRKVALAKTKPEYVWLGEYPKEAEQRKQGYSMAPVG